MSSSRPGGEDTGRMGGEDTGRMGGGEDTVDEPETSSAEGPARRASLLGSSVLMAAGTGISRVTGFVKNLFLVWALGSTLFADTYNLANSLPTSIYILVAGGALNAVFVPQLVRAMKDDDDGGEAFGQRLLTATVLLLAAVTTLAVVAAPLLVRAYGSSGLVDQPAYFDLAVTFARYCLPQIFFFGVYVIVGQVLNARGNFGPMMWAPILNNLVTIAVFATYIVITDARTPGALTAGDEALLGLGTTAGIALQALVLIPVLRRVGFRLRPRFDLRGAGLGRTGKLAIWTVGFVLVNQVWFLVAAKLTTGAGAQAELLGIDAGYGLTPYLSAFLIFQLPHAVIVVSLVTALLPRMSRSAAEGATDEVRSDLSHGLRVTAVALLPAAAAFLALGPVLTVAMYFRGSVTHQSAEVIGFILMGFAPALLGFSSHYTTLRGFYAYEDTRSPALIQLGVLAASSASAITAYYLLPVQWKTVGVAVAYGVGYWVGFTIGQAVLRRRLGGLDGGRILRTYLRAGAAALIAGVVAFVASRALVGVLGYGAWAALAAAGVGGVLLLAVYVGLGRLFGVRELTDLLDQVTARLRR